MSRDRWRLGLTDEVPVLLTAALILLVVVSVFTLAAYRSGLALLADEQREQAVGLATFVAGRVSERALPNGDDLRRWVPGADRASILAPDGSVLVSSRRAGAQEEQSLGPPPAGLVEDLAIQGGVGFSPGPGRTDHFVGFAAVPGDRALVARVDLAAGMLAAQLRGVRLLTGVVLAVDFAVFVLLLVFLRRLLGPLERLFARARQLHPQGAVGDGEVSDLKALVETLERGLAALAAPGTESADEIAALSRTLGGSLESGVLLVDEAGRLVAINRLGSDLLGIAPAAGRPVAEALAAHPELAGLLAGAVAADQGISRRELVLATAARRLDLGLTVHALRRDDGRTRGYLALFADLTESRRRAEEARLADRLASLGELVAGVAHELRNSLGTLRGYLGLVERATEGELRAEYLGEIRRETDHLQRVLEDFLSFARPGTVRPEPVDLLAVVRRAARDPGLAGAEIAVEDRRTTASPPLRSDGQLLERALRNLLHNAVQASGPRRPVSVTLSRSDAGVEIAIDDRGPGLPAEVRERLFQPFAPGRPGGVGLGLALAHRIVTLLGGRLSLDDRPDGGTRAALWFPSGDSVTNGDRQSPAEAAGDAPGGPRNPVDKEP